MVPSTSSTTPENTSVKVCCTLRLITTSSAGRARQQHCHVDAQQGQAAHRHQHPEGIVHQQAQRRVHPRDRCSGFLVARRLIPVFSTRISTMASTSQHHRAQRVPTFTACSPIWNSTSFMSRVRESKDQGAGDEAEHPMTSDNDSSASVLCRNQVRAAVLVFR